MMVSEIVKIFQSLILLLLIFNEILPIQPFKKWNTLTWK